MITARSLIFYVRAEDQASRVVKRVARDIGGLSRIRSAHTAIGEQQVKNYRDISNAQQQIQRNLTAIDRAQVAANRSARTLSAAQKSGRPIPIIQDLQTLHGANLRNLSTLRKQEELLASNLTDVERRARAASAALDLELSAAKIDRLHQFVQGFQNLSRAARLFGLGVGAALTFAAHSAAAFGTQLTLAASQARPAGASAAQTVKIATNLQKIVLDQMQQFPTSSQEMADSLYQIFSSTNIQNIGQAGELLKEFNRAAVAGQTDLKTMTNAGITMLNNFVGQGKEFSNITQALDVFFAAVRFGRMDATQFANSLSNVVATAKLAGLSFKDVANAIAALTRQTGAKFTSRDATGISRLIETLAKPDTIAGLSKIGVKVKDSQNNMRPLLDLITDISKHADLKGLNAINFFKTITALGSGKSGAQSTIQARRAFGFLVRDIENYQRVSKDISGDNKEFTRSFEALSKSPGVRWGILVNQFKALAIVIGTEAIPAIKRLGQPVVRLLRWFNGLSESTKHNIATIATFGSAALIVGGTIGVMAGSVLKLVLTIRQLHLAKLAGEAGFVSARFAIWGGVIAGLIYLLIKFNKQVKEIPDLTDKFKKEHPLENEALRKYLPPIVDSFAIAGAQAGDEFGKWFTKKIDFWINKDSIQQKTKDLKYATLGTPENTVATNAIKHTIQLQTIMNSRLGDFEKGLAKTYFASGSWENLLRIFNQLKLPLFSGSFNIGTENIKAFKAIGNANWQAQFNKVVSLDKISQANPTIKNFKALLDAKDALQKISTGNQYSAAEQYLSFLESTWTKEEKSSAKHSKNMAAIAKRNTKNARDEIESLLGNVQSLYDNFLSQNKTNFGDLFAGPFISGPRMQRSMNWGGKASGSDLLKDLKSQVFQFNKFNRDLATLKARGGPQTLIDQLQQIGPGGKENIAALMKLSPAQWSEYTKTWERGQATIKSTTMAQLNSQLKIYKAHGKAVARAIIKGIKSEDEALSNVLRNSILNMFPGLAHQGRLTPRVSVPGNIHGSTQTHYHVTTDDPKKTITELKHMTFRMRNSIF